MLSKLWNSIDFWRSAAISSFLYVLVSPFIRAFLH